MSTQTQNHPIVLPEVIDTVVLPAATAYSTRAKMLLVELLSNDRYLAHVNKLEVGIRPVQPSRSWRFQDYERTGRGRTRLIDFSIAALHDIGFDPTQVIVNTNIEGFQDTRATVVNEGQSLGTRIQVGLQRSTSRSAVFASDNSIAVASDYEHFLRSAYQRMEERGVDAILGICSRNQMKTYLAANDLDQDLGLGWNIFFPWRSKLNKYGIPFKTENGWDAGVVANCFLFNSERVTAEVIDKYYNLRKVLASPGAIKQIYEELYPDHGKGISDLARDLVSGSMFAPQRLEDLFSSIAGGRIAFQFCHPRMGLDVDTVNDFFIAYTDAYHAGSRAGYPTEIPLVEPYYDKPIVTLE